MTIGDPLQPSVKVDHVHRLAAWGVSLASGDETATNPFGRVDPKLAFTGWLLFGLMEGAATRQEVLTGRFEAAGVRSHKRGEG